MLRAISLAGNLGTGVIGPAFRRGYGRAIWFWGVSFMPTNRKSDGQAPTLDEAKAAFRAEYLKRRSDGGLY